MEYLYVKELSVLSLCKADLSSHRLHIVVYFLHQHAGVLCNYFMGKLLKQAILVFF